MLKLRAKPYKQKRKKEKKFVFLLQLNKTTKVIKLWS